MLATFTIIINLKINIPRLSLANENDEIQNINCFTRPVES